mgnify:CR=1 FL=1
MRIHTLVLLTATVLFAACAPQPTPTPSFQLPTSAAPIDLSNSPTPSVALTGKFTFAPGDGSIWVQDPISGKPKPIVKPSPQVFADAPHFSPDGTRVVYVRSSLQADGKARNEIHIVAIDGSDDQAIAAPQNARVAYNWPAYSRDGKWIYFTAMRPDPQKQQLAEIQRVPVTGGEPQKIIEDARVADVSPDGTKIVFMRFNYETFTAGLWIADTNGENARELLNDQVFVTIAAPHFSPDGQTILFVASGPNTRPLPGLSFRAPTCEPQLLCLFAQPALANGLPWDLWTVTADGSKFAQLTRVGSDSPWPAWSGDGKQIAFFDTSGTYLLDLANKVVSQFSRNGGHGVFDWAQP